MADRAEGGKDMANTALQLDYEPGGLSRRRKARRRWLMVVALLAFSGVGWWQGPPAYQGALRAYWRHRVAEYVAPPDRIVYEEDPNRWPALLAQPDYCSLARLCSPGTSPFVMYMAQPVDRLARVAALRMGDSTLFAHARRSPAGREFVVVVWVPYNGMRSNAQGATPDNQVRFGLCTSIWDGSKFRGDMLSPWIAPQAIAENPKAPLYARVYAGQVDPSDAAHFTIVYEIGDYADVLDGRLRDDETVLLRPRKFNHRLNPK